MPSSFPNLDALPVVDGSVIFLEENEKKNLHSTPTT